MPSISRSPRGELPGRLCEQPVGDLRVALPGGWAEVTRDLSRALSGSCVLIAGRRRLYPVPPASSDGTCSMSSQPCDVAMDSLAKALGSELAGQGFGLSASGHVGPCTSLFRKATFDGMNAMDLLPEIDADALRALARYVSAHLSVSPGMQVAEANKLPPQLLQPLFIVCVGASQVRVLTIAFVGGPVTGDRPDRKRTPYVLQVTTGDLLAGAAFISGEAPLPGESSRPVPMGFVVRYIARHAGEGIASTLDHIVSLETELFGAVDDGHWSSLAGHVRSTARKRTSMNENDVAGGLRSRAFTLASGYIAPAELCSSRGESLASHPAANPNNLPADGKPTESHVSVNHATIYHTPQPAPQQPVKPMQQLQPMPVFHNFLTQLSPSTTLATDPGSAAVSPRTPMEARPQALSLSPSTRNYFLPQSYSAYEIVL